MKNADNMLKKIMNEVDTNGDGRIQYEGTLFPDAAARVSRFQTSCNYADLRTYCTEFRTFVQKAEKQLATLFKAIDKDGNGKLDMAELQTAFKQAGLSVSNKRLDLFFHDMDINDDGFITFEEWR